MRTALVLCLLSGLGGCQSLRCPSCCLSEPMSVQPTMVMAVEPQPVYYHECAMPAVTTPCDDRCEMSTVSVCSPCIKTVEQKWVNETKTNTSVVLLSGFEYRGDSPIDISSLNLEDDYDKLSINLQPDMYLLGQFRQAVGSANLPILSSSIGDGYVIIAQSGNENHELRMKQNGDSLLLTVRSTVKDDTGVYSRELSQDRAKAVHESTTRELKRLLGVQ